MKKSFARFLLILTLMLVVMFFTASAAQAAKRVPGPLEGPKGVATATVQFVPIVSTNIGPVVTAQMPSATPKP